MSDKARNPRPVIGYVVVEWYLKPHCEDTPTVQRPMYYRRDDAEQIATIQNSGHSKYRRYTIAEVRELEKP